MTHDQRDPHQHPRRLHTRTTYGRLWAAVPRELGFLLPNLLVAVVSAQRALHPLLHRRRA